MTEKYYYTDAYARSLKIRIVDRKPDGGGIWILPDTTIAYPGGGGQLPDQASVSDIPVVESKTDGDDIWYRLERNPGSGLDEAVMVIDWNRRYYHMQQHTGQHVLSAVLKRHHYDTVSVHLGEEHTLVEVQGEPPDDAGMKAIEADCNTWIRRSAEVKSLWVTPEEIEQYPLRRPAKKWNRLRLIHIDQLDYVACGGTHVRNTGEIGYIKLAGIEKIRGRIRFKAFTGIKADRYFQQLHDLNTTLKTVLNADTESLVERIEALIRERAELQRKSDQYLKYYLRERGEELIGQNSLSNGVVFARLSEEDGVYAEQLTRLLAQEKGRPACLVYQSRFFFIVPDGSPISPNRFLNEKRTALDIKGGGPPGFVQGVFDIRKETDLKEALEAL